MNPVLYQIETGSGDKQSNVSLVSREDFERLKNLTDPKSEAQEQVCFIYALFRFIKFYFDLLSWCLEDQVIRDHQWSRHIIRSDSK